MSDSKPNGARETLEVLRRDGWCQAHARGGIRLCLAEAIAVADSSITYIGQLADLVDDVAREQFPERYERVGHSRFATTIWPFNDDPATTFADVELVLEKAAIKIDEAVA